MAQGIAHPAEAAAATRSGQHRATAVPGMSDVGISRSNGRRWAAAPDLGGLLLTRLLPRLGCGSLAIVLPGGRRHQVHGEAEGPAAVLHLHRWRTLRRVVLDSDIGLGESYMDGDWSSPDMAALIELLLRNVAHVPGGEGGVLPVRWLNRLRHLANANSLRGSRRNIVAHYDLGNDFFAQWLDTGMSYSSALFAAEGLSLEAAQTAKQDRVLALLAPASGQSVLEIGFGWGGLAERMAALGAHVTGLTLSPAQHAYAARRLGQADLAAQADLRLQDYREVQGQFDRIVSVEMLEAVGEAWWPKFFATLRDRLRPAGQIVLQTITIADDRFEAYRRGTDFIQRHIFPGGMLPSPSALQAHIDRAGLELRAVEPFGPSYARTLALWQERFQAAWPSIERLGFPQHFKRMWEFYLAYCEAGFRVGAIDVGLWHLGHRAQGTPA